MNGAKLIGLMFWTDKGPKYLLSLIIFSLVLYMFSVLIKAKKVNPHIYEMHLCTNNLLRCINFAIGIIYNIFDVISRVEF